MASFLGVEEGGPKQPYSFQHLAVTIEINTFLAKFQLKTRQSKIYTNML